MQLNNDVNIEHVEEAHRIFKVILSQPPTNPYRSPHLMHFKKVEKLEFKLLKN
jgi:hypothetical protein